ncbi:glycosyltransferase family 4 protein [archaeon]|nr:glycosyltransferase family 4 protein [archaeon]
MRVLLLAFKMDRGEALADALARHDHRVDVDAVGLKNNNLLQNLWRVFTGFWRYRGKYDLVITESFDYNGLLALLLHYVDRIPYIVYAKGFYPEDSKERTNSILRSIDSHLSQLILSEADHIVYISKHLEKKYQSHFTEENKTSILDKPCSVIYHSVDKAYLTQTTDMKHDCKRLLYVGNLDFKGKADGVEYLIDTIPDSIELHVIGSGIHYKRLVKKAKAAGKTNIRFLGKLETQQLVSEYNSAGVFVYPSYHDAFPTVVMEAQAMGIPVVVTDTSGASEAVLDGVTGFICEPDESFMDSVEKLSQDAELWNRMSNSAKHHIKKSLSWENTGNGFNQIITENLCE